MAINEDVRNFFDETIDGLIKSDKYFQDKKDWNIFTYICLKYYFFDSDDYNTEDVMEHIVDGANDCSIDAICNLPTEEQELAFIQTKFIKELDYTTIQGEVEEIKKSIQHLESKRYNSFRDELVRVYKDCQGNTESKSYKIIYFTSAVPRKNKKDKIKKELENDDIEIWFGDEIKAYIEGALEKTGKVKNGQLEIDNANNQLKFEDSVIVNISALSLKELYSKYQRALLGLNLRYYIRNKTVDSGLKETIATHPNAFWYLNNGLTIVADKIDIDGKIIRLEGFSIVNGGQTTKMIYDVDFEEKDNFFIPCKLILDKFTDNYITSDKIAVASNSQKPIKDKDLVANTPEQRDLKGKLKQENFLYITKGETIEKAYKDRTKHGTIDQLGKLIMCSILQMPWNRSRGKELYKDKSIYYRVYKNTNPKLFPQILELDYYYKDYTKTDSCSSTTNPILTRNARTYVLALICFASYIIQKNKQLDLSNISNNPETLDMISDEIMKMDKIIINKLDNEKEILYDLFGTISDYIIEYSYSINKGDIQDESNFLKKKDSYYDCIKKMNSELNRNTTTLKKLCMDLFYSTSDFQKL